MKSDLAHEHNEKMRALKVEWERKLAFQAQRAYADTSDIYWLAHDFVTALLAVDGQHTEEELGEALTKFKNDFLELPPAMTKQWRAFFDDISRAQYSGSAASPDDVQRLFIRGRDLVGETLRVATEPVDDFTKHVQVLRVLLANKEVEKAEERYRAIAVEYEKLSNEQKSLHYPHFHEIYQAILAARSAQQA